MNKKVLYKSISVFFLIAVWQMLSVIIGADFLLASPLLVVKRLFVLIFENDFLNTVFFSSVRIGKGFMFAFVFGIVLAVAASRYRLIEYFLWPCANVIKSVPIASFIILCLLWIDYEMLTVVIAFLIAFPVIYSNTLQGMKNADKQLIEVGNLYNIPFGRRFIYIYLPSVKPFLISSCNVAIGMAWKAGVAAEVIGIVKGSIGEKLYESKIYFQNSDLLAWTIVIILISAILEKVFVLLLKWLFRRIEQI